MESVLFHMIFFGNIESCVCDDAKDENVERHDLDGSHSWACAEDKKLHKKSI